MKERPSDLPGERAALEPLRKTLQQFVTDQCPNIPAVFLHVPLTGNFAQWLRWFVPSPEDAKARETYNG